MGVNPSGEHIYIYIYICTNTVLFISMGHAPSFPHRCKLVRKTDKVCGLGWTVFCHTGQSCHKRGRWRGGKVGEQHSIQAKKKLFDIEPGVRFSHQWSAEAVRQKWSSLPRSLDICRWMKNILSLRAKIPPPDQRQKCFWARIITLAHHEGCTCEPLALQHCTLPGQRPPPRAEGDTRMELHNMAS